jgi:hypothetical protein
LAIFVVKRVHSIVVWYLKALHEDDHREPAKPTFAVLPYQRDWGNSFLPGRLIPEKITSPFRKRFI